jgi:CheY-like chemotaxis protein
LAEKLIILIVDSNSSNLSLCKNLLESHNYVALTAQDTEEAINIYHRQHNYIQAILLNLSISGKTYLFAIPAFLDINKNVKIIAMSYEIEKSEISDYFQTKIFGFIKKPLEENKLLKCLEKITKIIK